MPEIFEVGLNDFNYLLKLPGETRERRWLQERLETLSVREGIILTAAAGGRRLERKVKDRLRRCAGRGVGESAQPVQLG